MADLLHQAVMRLAARCDGAVTKDHTGFNQSDVKFGHRLAAIPPEAWSPEMRRACWHMLRKYAAQLASVGLDYPAIPEPVNPARSLGADVVGVDERLMRHEARRAAYWATREAPRPSAGHPWRTPMAPAAARRVEVLEDGRIRLRFPYDAALVQKVKSIPGARWNPEPADKSWTVPPTDVALPLLLDLITREGFAADNQEALLARLRQAQAGVEARVAASAATDADLDIPGFGLTPRPFQRAGALYALREKRVIIADEMGLGKTLEALMVLEVARAYPAVVVCPASVKLIWVREGRRCLPRRNIAALGPRPIRYPELLDILVVNYDLLVDRATARPQADPERVAELRRREGLSLAAAKTRALADQGQTDEGPALRADLLRLHPKLHAVVLDEFHYCKNPKALRTKLARKLAKDVEYRLLLSGTPILNRPEELLPPLQILDRLDELGGYTKVRNRYAPLDLRTGRRGAAHLDEFHRRLRALCYVRRRKSEVLAELPPIQYTTVPLEIDNRAEYESAARDVVAWLQVGVAKDRAFLASIASLTREQQAEAIALRQKDVAYRAMQAEQLVRLNALKRLTARGKLAAAQDWIDTFLESEEKLVTFGHHVEIVHALATRYRAPSITGDTPIPERQAAVDRFQQDPRCTLIACNLQAGGVGITLTAASNVALLELPWTPGAVDQAAGRCLVEGTPVITARGMMPIEGVVVGDHVINRDGEWTDILAIWSRLYDGPITTVEYVGGTASPLVLTPDHRVWTRRGWIDAHQLLPTDELLTPRPAWGDGIPEIPILGRDPLEPWRVCADCGATPVVARQRCSACYQRAEKAGHHRTLTARRRPTRRIHLPAAVPLDDDLCFVIGWYLAEGWVRTGHGLGFAAHTRERPVLEWCGRYFSRLGIGWGIYEKAGTQGIELRAYSVELAATFGALFGRGAHRKRLPDGWLMELNERQGRILLDAYWGGDGSTTSRGTCSAVTASAGLAWDIAMLVERFGHRVLLRTGSVRSGEHHLVEYGPAITDGWRRVRRISTQHGRRVRVYDLTVKHGASFTAGLVAVHNCHRIGQAESVMVWYLVGDRTIDLDIAELIDAKRVDVNALTDGVVSEDGAGSILRALVSRLAGDAPVRAAVEAERQVADLWR